MSEQNNQMDWLKITASILLGVFLVKFVHMLVFTIFISIGYSIPTGNMRNTLLTIVGYFYLGLFITQLIYIIPLYLFFKRRSYRYIATGIIVGAVITALVNGGCYLMFASLW
jgi:hypothetical protein